MRLREGLSWCLCAGRAVFLDLERDRYFALPPALDAAFQSWAAGKAPALDELVACGIFTSGDTPAVAQAPAALPSPARDLAAEPAAGLRLREIVRAALAQRSAAAKLRRRRLADILAAAPQYCGTGPADEDAQVRRIAAAFSASALVLRAADRCLPRALAARELCHQAGIYPALVVGVRLDPFTAHCWVQLDEAVIVGDLEQVRLFTPILVVR